MKTETLKCCKQDYDFYEIVLPLKIFAKGNNDKYLYSELGKLHPCFSDDFLFDKKLCIKKKELVACVMVISRYKLAEYKSKNIKHGLCIQEMGQRKYFVSKEKKNRLIIFIVITMCLAGMVLLCTKKNYSKKKIIQTDTEVIKPDELDEINELNGKKTVNKKENFEIIGNLFSFIKENNGDIEFFSMKIEGFTGLFELKVNNIFPETVLDYLPEVKINSVKYDEDKPVITFSFTTKILVDNSDSEISVEKNTNNSIRKQLRNFIQKNQIDLINETVNPFSMKISSEKMSFGSLMSFLYEEKVNVSSLSISKNNSVCCVDMVFTDEMFLSEKKLFEGLNAYNDLFFLPENTVETKNVINELSVKKNIVEEKSVNKKKTKENILGTIIKNDGTVMEYFTNSEGKIEKRVR